MTPRGHIYERNNSFHLRYTMRVGKKIKQLSRKLCNKTETTPSKDSPSVITLAESWMEKINAVNTAGVHTCLCGRQCRRSAVITNT